MAIVGLVLGIVSIVFSFFTLSTWAPIVALILGVVGIVLSAMAMSAAKKTGGKSGMAVAGLVLSIIGSVFALLVTIICLPAACAAQQLLNEYNGLLNPLGNY